MKRWMAVASALLLAACSSPSSNQKLGEGELSKSEARSMGGVDEDGEDLCSEFGWYGDGVCDDFCPSDDEDCDDDNNENNASTNNENNASTNNENNTSTNNENNASTNNSNNMSGGECGGFAGIACNDDEWCNYEDGDFCGAADALGSCMPRPEACPDVYNPVCGCDGVTYGNECEANGAGIDIAATGTCGSPVCAADSDCAVGEVCVNGLCEPATTACVADSDCAAGEICANGLCEPDPTAQFCGGIAGLTCPQGQFCDYAIADMCGAGDQFGTCRPIPMACPDVYIPVCGCDQMTYGNSCDANAAGVAVFAEGECKLACQANTDCPQGQLCINGYCEDLAMGQCGGFAGFLCAADEWCDYPDDSMCGAADQIGQCLPRPDACIAVYDPVCGCDGQTYSNGCVANASGVDVAAQGACP